MCVTDTLSGEQIYASLYGQELKPGNSGLRHSKKGATAMNTEWTRRRFLKTGPTGSIVSEEPLRGLPPVPFTQSPAIIRYPAPCLLRSRKRLAGLFM
jgi:hypothetical protein